MRTEREREREREREIAKSKYIKYVKYMAEFLSFIANRDAAQMRPTEYPEHPRHLPLVLAVATQFHTLSAVTLTRDTADKNDLNAFFPVFRAPFYGLAICRPHLSADCCLG